MYNLSGKVALVTGAGKEAGIGRACALRLASEGADVAVADLASAAKDGWRGVHSVAAEIEATGRKALAINADLSKSADVQAMVKAAIEKLGKIDILVSNAGVAGVRLPVREMTEDGWNRTLAVNLTSHFLVCKAVSKHMIDRGQGGKIIITASINGKRAWPERSDYCASKSAAIGFTNSLAAELARFRINVNALCPGLVQSDLHKDWVIEESQRRGKDFDRMYRKYYDNMVSLIPWGASGTADDMANLVAFLASDQSDYMTGQAINVDGGLVTER